MPISNRNNETESLIRKLAAVADELNEIGVRCARRPVASDLDADQILGYDELGAPTR